MDNFVLTDTTSIEEMLTHLTSLEKDLKTFTDKIDRYEESLKDPISVRTRSLIEELNKEINEVKAILNERLSYLSEVVSDIIEFENKK